MDREDAFQFAVDVSGGTSGRAEFGDLAEHGECALGIEAAAALGLDFDEPGVFAEPVGDGRARHADLVAGCG